MIGLVPKTDTDMTWIKMNEASPLNAKVTSAAIWCW